MTIKAIAVSRDHGDGSVGVAIYNDREHYINSQIDDDTTREEVQEELEIIESGDDPYENGSLNEIDIELEEVDGKLRLKSPLYISWE